MESGKRVAVIDRSLDQDVFALLPFQEKENVFTYHGVEYHRDVREDGERIDIREDGERMDAQKDKERVNIQKDGGILGVWKDGGMIEIPYMEDLFDVVFLVVGAVEEVISDYPAEAWYVFLTADRKGIERTKQTFWEADVPVFLFIRNFCDYKITAAYIRGLWKEARGNIAGWYEIPFDLIDYEYGIRMQYEPVNEYRQLSREMSEAVVTVASKISGLTKKEEETIYKKMKRGKKRCR